MEQAMKQNYNHQVLLSELLKNSQTNGLSALDVNQLNLLINIDKQVSCAYTKLSDQSDLIIQRAIKIKEFYQSQKLDNSLLQYKKVRDAKLWTKIIDQLTGDYCIPSAAISNDINYITYGGTDKKLKIWSCEEIKEKKIIQLDNQICYVKFTDDTKYLYVAKQQFILQYDINNEFANTYNQPIHSKPINNIYCITNSIILTSSDDKSIRKTNINLNQSQFQITAHNYRIDGLDFNHNLNMIASASYDKSIKLWYGNNGQLFLEKYDAHNNDLEVCQVLFMINKNQLISLGITQLEKTNYAVIWNIKYEAKELEQLKYVSPGREIYNISLVLDQQYLTLVCENIIQIYSMQSGNFIKSFDHDVKDLNCLRPYMTSTIQLGSMKALLVQGVKTLQLCRLHFQ